MSGTNQIVYSGYGSYKSIENVLKSEGAKRPLLVCDSAFEFLFIKDYIRNLDFDFVYFSDFKPNPLYEDVEKGVRMFRENGCDFIVSIGGGSAIDVAKCIKLFAKMNDDTLHLKQEYKDSGIKHMAIPTTAGTGSESTRFAVCYYDGAKQSVTHESIIPNFAVLEPEFLKTLPMYQKKSTLLDALCQGIESLWSVNSTDESTEYSETAVKTILANLYKYLSGDEKATERISLAANLAGRAINITQTTAAHAMSYKITSLYGLAHGHAVAVCLPFVLYYMADNTDKCIDKRGTEHLEKVFNKLCELFYVDTIKECADRFLELLNELQMEFPKLKSPEDLDILVHSVNPVRLKNNPVELDEAAITEIYTKVFCEGNGCQKKNIEKFLKNYSLVYEIAELQKINLEILLSFDEFCKKHNLQYFLGEGTLLGVVRHGGFIPWDDDVDVYMKREDYEKFVELCKSCAPQNCVLDCFQTNKMHWTACAKLITKQNSRFFIPRLAGIALSTAPSIDIFPLDPVTLCNQADIKNRFKRAKLYKTLLWLKTGYSHDYSTYRWKILKAISLFLPLKTIRRRLMKAMNGKGDIVADGLANFGSLYDFSKETFKAEWFSSAVAMDFGEHSLPVPCKYRQVLSTVYGDYETMPPYSKRFPKHSYTVNIDAV